MAAFKIAGVMMKVMKKCAWHGRENRRPTQDSEQRGDQPILDISNGTGIGKVAPLIGPASAPLASRMDTSGSRSIKFIFQNPASSERELTCTCHDGEVLDMRFKLQQKVFVFYVVLGFQDFVTGERTYTALRVPMRDGQEVGYRALVSPHDRDA
jgi:hypothetical protein